MSRLSSSVGTAALLRCALTCLPDGRGGIPWVLSRHGAPPAAARQLRAWRCRRCPERLRRKQRGAVLKSRSVRQTWGLVLSGWLGKLWNVEEFCECAQFSVSSGEIARELTFLCVRRISLNAEYSCSAFKTAVRSVSKCRLILMGFKNHSFNNPDIISTM